MITNNNISKTKTAKVVQQNGISPKTQTTSKTNGQRLEPVDTQRSANVSNSSRPVERGGSEYDKRVSFFEERQDALHGDPTSPTSSNGAPARPQRVSSERVYPETARETGSSSSDAPRQGSLTWRKAPSEPVLFVSGAERTFMSADDSVIDQRERFGSSKNGFEYEPSGRKFTSKPTKSSFGSNTSLSTATESSDDSDDVFNVILRVRPLNTQETLRRDKFVADFPGDGQVSINNSGSIRNFQFNVVFEPDATQEDVFENSGIKKLVDAALNGELELFSRSVSTHLLLPMKNIQAEKRNYLMNHRRSFKREVIYVHCVFSCPGVRARIVQYYRPNDCEPNVRYTCTAFAFGQTGSGKTHTMTGPPAQFHTEGVTPDPAMYGLIQRCFKYLYQSIKKLGTPRVIKASFLEVYNEQVIDLLNNSQRRYLTVRWSKNKGFYVENLFTVQCEALDDLMAVLEEGLRNRQTGSHGLNEFSSRSHSVLTVTVDSETQPEPDDENLYVTKRGKLSFVDLAGSEKVRDSNMNAGPGMTESNSINKSLLVLGNCISHLCDPKKRQGHIPYRDSKLTKLLADSLGGNGISLMIACITPASSNVTETMNTLRYASRAKKIKTKPTIKMDPREKLIVSLKKEIKILRQENHYLRQQLDFPAKPRGQLQKENDEKFQQFMKEQHQKESGLYDMLQEYMVENENLRAENSDMHATKESSRREQQILYRENEKLLRRVEELERMMAENPGTWTLLDHHRTDGYGQQDLSPRGSPVILAGRSPPQRTTIRPAGSSPSKIPAPMFGQPQKPPHRLPDHVVRPAPRPVEYIEDNIYNNDRKSPRQSTLVKQGVTSPIFIERRASQTSHTDMIRDLNDKLRQDVMDLDGQIQTHARMVTNSNHYR